MPEARTRHRPRQRGQWRSWSGHRPSAQKVLTVVLLALFAVAVALVLAQSAGVVHIGFLGPVA